MYSIHAAHQGPYHMRHAPRHLTRPVSFHPLGDFALLVITKLPESDSLQASMSPSS